MRDHYDLYARYLRQTEPWRHAMEMMDALDPLKDVRSAIEAAHERMSISARIAAVADRYGRGHFSDIPGLTRTAAEMAGMAGVQSIVDIANQFSPASQASPHLFSLYDQLDPSPSRDLREALANITSPFSRQDLFGGSEVDKIAAHLGMVSSSAEAFRLQAALAHPLAGTAAFDQAYELAQAAQHYHLDDYLDRFKTAVGPLTDKMLYLNSLEPIRSEEHLRSFVQASTVADILGNSPGYGFEAQQALAILTQQAIPQFDSVQEYGHVLKAAGIALAPWPHIRLLTIAERRKRLRQRIDAQHESKHAKKAWTVFRRHELTLREIIDMVMTDCYGEDWPHERLEKCGCRALLGKWKNRGGAPLDHADYHEYIEIMCDEEHFENVFSLGFEEAEELRRLLAKARQLRAAVMHFHPFTKEDLRDLRTTWKAIEAGLLGLTNEYDLVVYH